MEQTKENINLTKHEVRKIVNNQDFKIIDKIAKKLGVDTSKYEGLQNGLKKMSMVNSIVGAVSRLMIKEKHTAAAVKAIVKSCIDTTDKPKRKAGRPKKETLQ